MSYVRKAGIKIGGRNINNLRYADDTTLMAESEIKESIPFTTATKRIKYLGINFPKERKQLNTESIHINHLHFYTLTMKNLKEKLRNQSHSPLQKKELNI